MPFGGLGIFSGGTEDGQYVYIYIVCTDVPDRYQYRFQQRTEEYDFSASPEVPADTVGYYQRDAGFFRTCQPAAQPLEYLRLYGGGKRLCLLFPVIRTDHAVQGSLNRAPAGYGTGYYRFAGEYIQGDDGFAGCAIACAVFRAVGTYLGGRRQFDGCDIACDYPLFGEGYGSRSHISWPAH